MGEVFRKSQGIERLLEGLGRVLRLATGSLEALLRCASVYLNALNNRGAALIHNLAQGS